MKLLNAFAEQVKACGKLKTVWLTSFNIDIEFIETYLLPAVLGAEIPRTRMDYEALQLVLNESGIDFRVFCDRRFIGADQNKRTAIQVHGISPSEKEDRRRFGISEESLFHAKVIYLEGDKGKVLGSGSANLTISGWGRNQEVFHFLPVDSLPLYQSLKAFFEAVFRNVGKECPLKRRSAFPRTESAAHFCHSFQKEPFVSQLLGGRTCRHLAVWSPYLPGDLAGFIGHLKGSLDQPHMKVSLVADRVEGQYLRTRWSESLGQLIEGGDLCLCQKPRPVDERVPMTHAKVWKTATHLAIGSWNFTRPGANALLDSQGRRLPGNNIEAGFIIPDSSPVTGVLGSLIEAGEQCFASDELLGKEALQVPEALPFDLVVEFDWARQVYRLSGQWISDEQPEAGYSVALPDLEAEVDLHWMPRKRLLEPGERPVGTVRSLLSDHCFRVLKNGSVRYVGMLLETSTKFRRAQQYDDLKGLFDAMAQSGPEPSLDDASFRVSETENGELLLDGSWAEDSLSRDEVEQATREISYFRLFTASYHYAARLRSITDKDVSGLEHWVFIRPGCLEELVCKARERIATSGPSVFNWFLAQEVNGLCELALEVRKRLSKEKLTIPLPRWQALSVDEPQLPQEANDAYRQTLQAEYRKISSKWGAQ